MAERPLPQATDNTPARFPHRRDRQQTQRRQELQVMIDNGEYSPRGGNPLKSGASNGSRSSSRSATPSGSANPSRLAALSRPRKTQNAVIDDSGYEADEGGEDNDENDVEDGEQDDMEALASTQQSLHDSDIHVGGDAPISSRLENQGNGHSAGTQQALHESGVDTGNQITNHITSSRGMRDDPTDVSGIEGDVEDMGTVNNTPLVAPKKKKRRKIFSEKYQKIIEYEYDFSEGEPDIVDLDFSPYEKHPNWWDPVHAARRQRKNITVNDHAHPSPFAETLLASQSTRSPSAQPTSGPLVQSQLFTDTFSTFTNADDSIVQTSSDRTGEIDLTDEPLSRKNCTISLMDLDYSWVDKSQIVLVHPIIDGVKNTSGKTGEEIMGEAWEGRVVAHDQHNRPLVVRDGKLEWEQSYIRDEDAQDQDPVPFRPPFEEILNQGFYGRYDYTSDFYNMPERFWRQLELARNREIDMFLDEEDAQERSVAMPEPQGREEVPETRMRGGALPEPHGEHGLDERDLAAVQLVYGTLHNEQGGMCGDCGKKGGQQLVEVSQHVNVGDDSGACWCIDMPEIDQYGSYSRP